MKELQLNDFLKYAYLSNPTYNPSGTAAAFTVSRANEEGDGYESYLHVLDEKGTVRLLTGMGKESRFVWEDDTHLLIPTVRREKEKKEAASGVASTHFYRIDIHGGEAMPAFSLPFACGKIILPYGDARLYALGTIDAADPDNYLDSPEERAQKAAAKKENADYEVLTEIPFWGNGQGFTNGNRTALFYMEGDKITRLTEPDFDVEDMKLIGDDLYFFGSPRKSTLVFSSTLCRRNIKTGETETLISGTDLRISGIEKLGDTLLIMGTEGKRYGLNENSVVYRWDEDSKQPVLLRDEQENMYNSTGSDCRLGGGKQSAVLGDELYHLTTRWGNCHIYKLNAKGESTPVLERDGSVDAMDASGNTILMVAMFDNKLQELYALNLETGDVKQLTFFNSEAFPDTYVAEPKRLTLQSCGLEIEGWVLEPKGYDPAKKYPAVLDIHGGPKTVYGPIFYHEMQVWANRGYFVMFCNPKGGDGRGNEFADIRGQYGHTDFRNIMDFTDEVLRLYPQIDEKKVAVTGGSYGGFMTNWIIGHTDRFACAASQRSISNWLSFYGISDIGTYFAADQCDGNLYDDAEKLWDLSPLKYAANVKTPTLFIHSDEDYRCPMAEGLQMYTALVDRGVPARLCWFRGENHELSRSGKPKHRLRRLEEITNWIEKYTK